MKTAKEFIERMQSDEAFAAQMREKVAAAKEAGAEDLFAAVSAAAAELGYEISAEQIKALNAAQSEDVAVVVFHFIDRAGLSRIGVAQIAYFLFVVL